MSGAGSHFGGTYDDPHIRVMIDRELAERKEKAAREAEIVRLREALAVATKALAVATKRADDLAERVADEQKAGTR
jgi:hypothetical protein